MLTDTLDAATASLPPGDICLLKADIEGHEIAAFRGAEALLKSRRVANIQMEYSPGAYERKRRYSEMKDWPELLARWIDAGYVVRQIHDKKAMHSKLTEGGFRTRSTASEWEEPLRPLKVVTHEILRHDIDDATHLAEGRGNMVYGHHKARGA